MTYSDIDSDAVSGTPFESKSAFLFGCGYLGIRVARKLLGEGWQVSALTRSERRAAALAAEGIRPWIGDWTDRRTLVNLPSAARVLISVGYDPRSKKSRHEVYVEGLRAALQVVHPQSRVVYVSSTGVFHHNDGRWVDESSPCHPTSEGGRAHLQAESLLRSARSQPSGLQSSGLQTPGFHSSGEASSGGATVVLRMAGLYGPGRVPRIAAIRGGETIATSSRGFLNLIHIDDAAECVIRAWNHPHPAPLYVIADGNPVIRSEYYQEMARLTGSPAVRFGEPAASSRGDSNKRIWTARMRRDLLRRLEFPSYREGLRSILRRA